MHSRATTAKLQSARGTRTMECRTLDTRLRTMDYRPRLSGLHWSQGKTGSYKKTEQNNANYVPFNFRAENRAGWQEMCGCGRIEDWKWVEWVPGGPMSICLTFRVLFCHPLSFVHVVSFSNMCPALAGRGFLPAFPLLCSSPPGFLFFFSLFSCPDGSTLATLFYDGKAWPCEEEQHANAAWVFSASFGGGAT